MHFKPFIITNQSMLTSEEIVEVKNEMEVLYTSCKLNSQLFDVKINNRYKLAKGKISKFPAPLL